MNSRHSLHAKLNTKIYDLGLLGLRIWAGQEFLIAGYTKLSGGIHAPEWFAGLQFPFPLYLLSADINWVTAGTGEIVFGMALLIGLCSRLAALGLLVITFVAVYSVHFDLGWAGWNQIETDTGLGFKVPLMLAVMLFAIFTQGGGRYSLKQ
jgi:putative oxidoreductase